MQKPFRLFEKTFNMSCIVFYTYYNSHLTFQLNTLKNLPLDLLICRNCWFWDIYVLQSKTATQ